MTAGLGVPSTLTWNGEQQDRSGNARRGGHGRDHEGRRQGHGLGPPSAEHLATVTGSGPPAHLMTGKFAQVKYC